MSASSKNQEELLQWYVQKRPMYVNLANKVASIIQEVLDAEGITYYSITSRAKDIESFLKKAQKDKYVDPKNQIQDFAGIRVITYVKSEVHQCCNSIKPLFEIDTKNSSDKSIELGKDKVGYRSIHYVAKLTEDRLTMPEYKIYKDLNFEIQVRTILEHAWADIAHDRSYKFQGDFPAEYDVERRFALASAALELVDNEFDSIVNKLNEYQNEIERKSQQGETNFLINTTSLDNYLFNRFKEEIEEGLLKPGYYEREIDALNELIRFGIKTTDQLDSLLTKAIKKLPEVMFNNNNFMGLIRYSLLLEDSEKYFDTAWDRSWTRADQDIYEILRFVGKDPYEVAIKYNLYMNWEIPSDSTQTDNS